MKITKAFRITIFSVGLGTSIAGCSLISVRDTPVVKVVREYAPAVVNIRTESIVDLREHPDWGKYGEQLDFFLKEYFGGDYSSGTLKHKSIGSGVILDNDGFIVTNAHVIQKATSIYVVLRDATTVEAEVVGLHAQDDLAIIKTRLPRSTICSCIGKNRQVSFPKGLFEIVSGLTYREHA